MFYLYDGDHFNPRAYGDVDTALAEAKRFIDLARDNCDPEWPAWVEDIAIYEAPEGCAEPDEDGTLLYRTQMTKIRDADPETEFVDFICDYGMMPPTEELKTA